MSIALSAPRPTPRARTPRRTPSRLDWDASGAPYHIEEARWGFRVRAREGEPVLQRVAQALAMTVGAASVAGAVALLWPLVTGTAGGTLSLRIGLAALIAGGGLLLLWFASRGTLVEAEMDSARGEVRLIVRNQVGRPTLMGCHGFDTVLGVSLMRDFGGRGFAMLSLDLASGGSVAIASGREGALAPLRRRLERDLLISARAAALAGGMADAPLSDFELCAA